MNLEPLPIPQTYVEWSACLERFETGLDDQATIAVMRQGKLSWSSGVAELFSERLSATLSVRLQRCSDQMSRQLHSGADEVALVRALTNTRQILANLNVLATLEAFPEVLTAHLSKELKLYAERTQKSLEDSARSDRSGRLASLIRNNSLLQFSAPVPAKSDDAKPAAPPPSQSSPNRRRNFL